ncbi:MAG: hypothetical protein K9L59_02235 [Desulfobacterales bacterium]|nr:hypothetical protein [Desulfobacterales bacterium]
MDRLCHETLPASLFTSAPLVRFYPEQDVCSCGGKLNVQKTRQKTVLSLTTPFLADETVLCCPLCGSNFFSEPLRRLVPKSCNFAWDVIVFVGRSMFEQHQSVDQVRKALLARNVTISPSQVDYLGQKFITYLAIAHRQATPRINQAMTGQRGRTTTSL